MLALLETAGTYAIVIVATVEAMRSRIPSLDGWFVLTIAGLISIILSLLFMTEATTPALLDAARIAVLAWIIAVGGDAWTGKVAKKVGSWQ